MTCTQNSIFAKNTAQTILTPKSNLLPSQCAYIGEVQNLKDPSGWVKYLTAIIFK